MRKSEMVPLVRTATAATATTAYAAIALFLGGFGFWAATAPLAGAAIAPGVIAAAGRNQPIQHLEGGIIRVVHVGEGDRVRAGDPLFEMDPTRAQASLDLRFKQWIALQAQQTRLRGQRDRLSELTFSDNVVQLANEHGLSELLQEQSAEFAARHARSKSETAILVQRVVGGERALTGFESQHEALMKQLDVVNRETTRKQGLLERGLTTSSDYTNLLRSQADLVGQVGATMSRIEQTRSEIIEAQEQMARQETTQLEETLKELNEVSLQIASVEEELEAAQDIADRLVVRAPSDGILITVRFTRPGSVIAPGEELARLLPTNSDLIVEAQIGPHDIDLIRIDQSANLRLVALNSRTTPVVPGTVIFISPDRLIDERTDAEHYVVRLRMTSELPPEVDLRQIYPGMPVETLISTGERTFLEYLWKPLSDSFSLAFRES